MRNIRTAFAAFLVVSCALLSATKGEAATVTFDFSTSVTAPFLLDEDSPGIVNGNCNGSLSGASCLGVNSQGDARLSVQSGTFSVLSFWFQLLGKNSDLVVETTKGLLTLPASTYLSNNGGQLIDVSGNILFQNIDFISFLTSSGNARIDDVTVNRVDIAPVPLPASGLVLLAGLGGLAIIRRRKSLA